MRITKQERSSKVAEIKIEKEGDKKQHIAILHKTLPQKDERSVWSWFEEFTTEWSETFMTKKEKRDSTS